MNVVNHMVEHAAMTVQLAQMAHSQAWGTRVAHHREPNGKEFHRYTSGTHHTEVVHHGSETAIYRNQHTRAPANIQALHRASVVGMGGQWGQYHGGTRLPNGGEVHVFNSGTHRTTVVLKGPKIITHRKPIGSVS